MIKAATMLALLAASAGAVHAQEDSKAMDITRKSDLKTVSGPKEYFTGNATITGQFQRSDPSRVSGAIVHFEAGARTAWHTHPAGQTLIVISGLGRVQREGGPIEEIRPGDVVWVEPNEKHWHGASANKAMSHVAIQEDVNGEVVTWMDKVSDDQYSK